MFEGGSIHLQRGMTTLRDGTILLPFNDSVNHVNYNNSEAALFVARSTDSGHTWAGTDQPIDLPVDFREAWGGGSRIVELADGTLLQSIWGLRELTPDWTTDPMPYEAGVLLSFVGGVTWPEYHRMLQDPHSPAFDYGGGQLIPGGANESTLVALPDGRVAAFIRFEAAVGSQFWPNFVSYSEDGGRTWSDPLTSGHSAQTLSATLAPCTDHLADGQAKIAVGYRARSNQAAVSVSFDGGMTLEGETILRDPAGGTQHLSAEPDYVRIDDQTLLTVFQIRSPGGEFRLAANLLRDADADGCQDEAAAAGQRALATPAFHIEREDRDSWFLTMSNQRVTHPSTRLVGDVIRTHASQVVCHPTDSLRLTTPDGSVLDPTSSLGQAGVTNGAVLQLSGTSSAAELFRIGYTELDIAPQDRSVANWDRTCAGGRMAFDYRRRSLGLEVSLPAGQAVGAVELRDENSVTRLTQGSYRLLSSPDNVEYADVEGWSLSSRVEAGRLIHRFAGFATTDRYLKIAQNRGDTVFTFVLGNPRHDLSVELVDLACDRSVTGEHDGALAVTEGLTCLDCAVVDGPVTVSGGALRVRDSVVVGPVRSTGADAVSFCGTELTGPVSVIGTAGLVQLGDAALGCAADVVLGPVSVSDNLSGVRIGGNRIEGPLTCTGNHIPPTNDGVPNTVTGPRGDQCAEL